MIKEFNGKKYRLVAASIRGTCLGCDIDNAITDKPELHDSAMRNICGSCTYGATTDQIYKELVNVPSTIKREHNPARCDSER